MIKGVGYNEIIQSILDDCKEWSNGDRVGRFYCIRDFSFVKDYDNTEFEILLDLSTSCELFEIYDKASDIKLSKIKLSKEGYLCVSESDWNYSKHLRRKKRKQRDLLFKLLLAFIGFCFGVVTVFIKQWLE